MKLKDIFEGSKVIFDQDRVGIVRFVGKTKFSNGVYIGLEFDRSSGDTSGTVDGVEYFRTKPNHGLFCQSQFCEPYDEGFEELTPRSRKQNSSRSEYVSPIIGHNSIASPRGAIGSSNIGATFGYNNTNVSSQLKTPRRSNGSIQSNGSMQSNGSNASMPSMVTLKPDTDSYNAGAIGLDGVANGYTSFQTPRSTNNNNNNYNNNPSSSQSMSSMSMNRLSPNQRQVRAQNTQVLSFPKSSSPDHNIGNNNSGYGFNDTNPNIYTNNPSNNYTNNTIDSAIKPRTVSNRVGGSVWVWGGNGHSELTIPDSKIVRVPTMIRTPKLPIAVISPGLTHMAILTIDGRVSTSGSWLSNLLGHQGINHDLCKFKMLPPLDPQYSDFNPASYIEDKVVTVVTSDLHSVAQLASGHIVTWGGSLHGKLGRGEAVTPAATPSASSSSSFRALPSPISQQSLHTPLQTGSFSIVSALRGHKVVSVSCGTWHTVVCTDAGDVWTFGGGGKHNNYGQLGHGTNDDVHLPTRVATLVNRDVHIRQVVAGAYHTLALSNDKQLYTWGKGDYGQLGLTVNTNINIPAHVVSLPSLPPTLSEITQHNAWIHERHASALQQGFKENTGPYAAFFGHNHLVDEPFPPELCGQGSVFMAAAGDNHSMVLLTDGTVYSFGFGQYGQLGHGAIDNEKLPRLVNYFYDRHIKVVQIACGTWHSLCLTNEHEVYTWGHGEKGQLGLGSLQHRSLPSLVEDLLGEDIHQIAAGGPHSVAYTAEFITITEMEELYKQDFTKYAHHIADGGVKKVKKTLAQQLDFNSLGDEDKEVTSGGGGFYNPLSDPYSDEYQEYARCCEQKLHELGFTLSSTYSPTVGNTHRFITFQTHTPLPHIKQWVNEYLETCYNEDVGVCFDNLIAVPGTSGYNGLVKSIHKGSDAYYGVRHESKYGSSPSEINSPFKFNQGKSAYVSDVSSLSINDMFKCDNRNGLFNESIVTDIMVDECINVNSHLTPQQQQQQPQSQYQDYEDDNMNGLMSLPDANLNSNKVNITAEIERGSANKDGLTRITLQMITSTPHTSTAAWAMHVFSHVIQKARLHPKDMRVIKEDMDIYCDKYMDPETGDEKTDVLVPRGDKRTPLWQRVSLREIVPIAEKQRQTTYTQ